MKDTFSLSLRSVIITLLVMALTVASLTGCGKKVIVTPQASPSKGAEQQLSEQALAAYNSGDYTAASSLYDRILQKQNLTRAQKRSAWRYYALSTIKSGRATLGLQALDKWESNQPGVIDSTEWQDMWMMAVKQLPAHKSLAILESTYAKTSNPWGLRANAALLLAGVEWRKGNTGAALTSLEDLYAKAPSKKYKAALERSLFAELNAIDAQLLATISGFLTPENEITYPYSLVLLEKARRAAGDEQNWPSAWAAIERLRSLGKLADPTIIDAVLAPLKKEFGEPTHGIALTLPLTGPYGSIGWKIVRGAGIAHWQLTNNGYNFALKVINTESATWEQELAALPEGFTIVGGPLRKDVFRKIYDKDLTEKHAFFTFLSSLPAGTEGEDAWRFFSSPKDQIQTLLNFAQFDLGINNFAALYPDENYGKHMSQLFVERASQQTEYPVLTASYTPNQPQGWSKDVKKLLVQSDQENKELHAADGSFTNASSQEQYKDLPYKPAFQAVFLPDSWKNMESIIPHFFFHQEDRAVFLGPTLWEQGLSAGRKLESRYFKLAIFPGIWNPFTPTNASKQLVQAMDDAGLGKPDAWVGLGYDFIRLAAGMGSMPADWDDDTVNEELASAQSMDWSIAPISWDADGLASENLFLFRPSRNGFVPINPESFANRLNAVRVRHDERIQMMKDEADTDKAKELGLTIEEYRMQRNEAANDVHTTETAEADNSGLFSFETTPATSQ
ncbi:penicillin-binding protein activator [Halodesulfovibrio sp.]|uniref:penicillin-binding protein activator n=1 Tax=Halodesulfovibrio sp. TaxID=1912772 RepID=UPI0025F1674E|nr:penicillin-binding protein activator [Halodesulfovibrio sp.]MCT4534547.1 penicillin-binding protein activator [Halodesulfovibrio sp.]